MKSYKKEQLEDTKFSAITESYLEKETALLNNWKKSFIGIIANDRKVIFKTRIFEEKI